MKNLLFFLLFINVSISIPNTQPLPEFLHEAIKNANVAKEAILKGKDFANKVLQQDPSILPQINLEEKEENDEPFFFFHGPIIYNRSDQIKAIDWNELKKLVSKNINFSDSYDDFFKLLQLKDELDFCNLYRDESIPEEWCNNYCHYKALLEWSNHKNKKN